MEFYIEFLKLYILDQWIALQFSMPQIAFFIFAIVEIS